MNLENLLSGGDLRSLGKSKAVIAIIQNQHDFDELFEFLFHPDKVIVMRAADSIEKITIKYPEFLASHKTKFMALFYNARDKELQWHLALMVPRFNLTDEEYGAIWEELTKWAREKTISRIVRVCSVQALFEMTGKRSNLVTDLALTLDELEQENIPSLNARIRKIRKQ